MTTTLASSSHEIINPANVIQPRAFVIAKTVAGLLTVAAACILSFLGRVASCAVAGSTTAFDGRGDATGPVPMVEGKSPTLPLLSTPIGAGRAFRFRGRWGRLFFMAYLFLLKTCVCREPHPICRFNSAILVMKAAENGSCSDATNALDRSMEWRVFAE